MATDYVQAEQQRILDAAYPTGATTHRILWSVNGTSEWAGLASTPIGSYAAATATDPSHKSNAAKILSDAATAAGTVSHYALATSAGTRTTVWKALSVAVPLVVGGRLEVEAGGLDLSV